MWKLLGNLEIILKAINIFIRNNPHLITIIDGLISIKTNEI